MTALISTNLVRNLKPSDKPIEVRDSRVKGFILRVQPSGVMTYYVEYGRGMRRRIGPATLYKPDEARTEARKVLAAFHKGEDPKANERKRSVRSLREFIEKVYEPWATVHLKCGKATCARLGSSFPKLIGKPLVDIDARTVEAWRAKRLASGTKPSTVNRDLNDLKAAMTRAVAWGYRDDHDLRSVKPSRTDRNKKCRFLDDEEIKRLRDALDAREDRLRTERKSANEWRQRRSRNLYPDLDTVAFADHLKPMVLLSLHTGLRRGELFALTWGDVDFGNANLTVRGGIAKSGRTRHIPLNSEAMEVLRGWLIQTELGNRLVFSNKKGRPFDNVNTAWSAVLKAAKIENFRWHDLRHTFASRLAMAGVDLNTVRELLGHSDYTMTLRYAHLAPSHKAKAVERLVG